METHVGVAVAVLNAHYEVADDGNARTIAGELLAGHLGIVLLRLDELVVEVKVVGFARQELAGAHEYLHEKPVQSHCCIEVVTASRLGGVGRVGGAQFLDAAKNGVGGAGAEGGMEREMGHQVACHVFDAAPPQKYTLISERVISLYWYPKVVHRSPSSPSTTEPM